MMEKEFYTDDGFEQLIKERADQFSMYPSKRVWHSIYNNLHPSRRWPSVVMSLLLISSLMLIGYLHTGDNSNNRPINNTASNKNSEEKNIVPNTANKKQAPSYSKTQQPPVADYNDAFDDLITSETDFYTYTIVKNNRPGATAETDAKITPDKTSADINAADLIQSMDTYIKSNKIFADVAAVTNKKHIPNTATPTVKNNSQEEFTADEINTTAENRSSSLLINSNNNTDLNKLAEVDKNTLISPVVDKDGLTAEEKAWIENFAFHNKSASGKWKNRLSYQFYATPAVNYRKLSTDSKGSATAFANADINKAISQKPGFGMEAGAGLGYAVTKRLQLKAGLQFNYTNYNIDADKTSHPIITTIVLNDPSTGYSYAAPRTSTTANVYNGSALQPVTLHNRTYQVSVPVGMAYRLSSKNNVDWFAGASVQPTYVFGGNAHIISSDLKSYISDPSSIRTWNLNLGFETYMNFKVGGGYNIQVGPQVRYQVYSTYRKNVALIEKPYAVGLKLGLSKGF